MTWLAIRAFIGKYWPALVLAAVLAGSHYWAFSHGVSTTQLKADLVTADRDARDAKALADAEEAARVEEQRLQANSEKVQRDATQALEQARTDADSANGAADRLREQVRKLLAARNSPSSTSVSGAAQRVENPGNLLAVVLDKSVERNKQLAKIADDARVKRAQCQALYEGLLLRSRP